MNSKIKIGAVSYLNAKPLIYGLEHSDFKNQIEFSIDYPSMLAQKLIDGVIDIGLVPVATIPHLQDPHIVSDYCIAAHKKVNSVCIFSEVPIEEVTHVFLDYQSRTSVRLAQVLLEKYWKKTVEFIPAHESYIQDISGHTAGVIIGDRALYQLNQFEFVYDLSEYWYALTGYDFVFAAWISNKNIPSSFVSEFNAANQLGFEQLDKIIEQNEIDYYDLKKYYTQDIIYKLDDNKIKGLSAFLKILKPEIQLNFNQNLKLNY